MNWRKPITNFYIRGKPLNKKIKDIIWLKYRSTCQHCNIKYKTRDIYGAIIPFEIHHLQPKCLKGEESIENLILLCKTCHRKYYHTGKNNSIHLSRKRKLLN